MRIGDRLVERDMWFYRAAGRGFRAVFSVLGLCWRMSVASTLPLRRRVSTYPCTDGRAALGTSHHALRKPSSTTSIFDRLSSAWLREGPLGERRDATATAM
jgi:hypothetical protein